MSDSHSPFPDFQKMLEQFKIPGVDMHAMIEARRKDFEALTEANRIAYEGMQSLVRRQTELVRQAMEQMQASARDMAGGGVAPDASKQAERVQHALQTAFQNMRELAEMARKSQTEAYETLNKRAQQNIEDLKKLLHPR